MSAIRTLGIDARVHPLEPAESPTLSTGHKVGRHRIQGVSDEFIPGIRRLDRLAPVIQVSDGDAILMAQKLARELGLGVGISSGANLLEALQVLEREGWDATVATILLRRQQKASLDRPGTSRGRPARVHESRRRTARLRDHARARPVNSRADIPAQPARYSLIWLCAGGARHDFGRFAFACEKHTESDPVSCEIIHRNCECSSQLW